MSCFWSDPNPKSVMMISCKFPTQLHQQIAELAHDFFQRHPSVDTTLIVNSCARGDATRESDLDLAILVKPSTSRADFQKLEDLWRNFLFTNSVVLQFRKSGKFTRVHLDLFDGQFTPPVWDDGGGPDGFELEIGNRIAHAVPYLEAGPYFLELQSRWLPYYDEDLRNRRLAMAQAACIYDLEHVPFSLERGLYFHAFDRLYKAFQEFVQALCISRRIYPVAYNKWIRQQVEDWMELPGLYKELPGILSVNNLESNELIEKAKALQAILERWTQPFL
jgi:predicted nucleotidyltransferase